MKTTLLSLFLVLLASMVHANGVDTLHTEAKKWDSPWRSFLNYHDFNPAATYVIPVNNYRDLGLTYASSHADKYLHKVQDGNGNRAFTLHSESFKRDSAYRYFGKASYLNDQKTNVQWRDVEDVALLTPYIVADSVGGTYKREHYLLSGGASERLANAEWGLRATYQGGVAYRQVDPRPQNTVSVIRINPGFTFFHQQWKYGWFGEYERYRQNVNIQVIKEDKRVYFYLLQGFGVYNQQFSELAESFTRIYKGNTFSTGIHVNYVTPTHSSGLLISAKSAVIDVDESDRRTPYQLSRNEVNTQVTYQRLFLKRSLFVKGQYLFQQVIGNETQYTPVTVHTNQVEWQYATQSDRYESRLHKMQLSLLLTHTDESKFYVWEQLNGEWQHARSNYYTPNQHQQIQNVKGSATIGIHCPFKQASFSGFVKGGYQSAIQSSLVQYENNLIANQLLIPDYTYLSSDYSFWEMNFKVRFKVSNHLWANLSVAGELFTTGNREAYWASTCLGINF